MRVDRCCCCVGLRRAVVAIGCFCSVTGLLGAAGFFASSSLMKNAEYRLRSLSGVFLGSGLLCLMQALAGLALVRGVHKEDAGCLLLWTVATVMHFFVGLTALLLVTVEVWSTGSAPTVWGVALELLYCAMQAYFLVVVHSYRKSLAERSTVAVMT